MKLRKALVASAAALSVSFAGVSVAQAEEPATAVSTQETNDSTTTQDEGSSDSDSFFTSSDEDGNVDPKKISSWLGVFTTIIGILSSIMGGEGLALGDITSLLGKLF